MKKYSYHLFPTQLIILGYILIVLSLAGIYLTIPSDMNNIDYQTIGLSIAFTFVGLIMITFKSVMLIDKATFAIFKESRMLGIALSREKVNVPKDCTELIIKTKTKTGTGYYKAVIPMHYKIKSCDMYFNFNNKLVLLIKTDYNRALKITEWIKENFNIESRFI